MPEDFVKQLQLAKQLERKAKEAARGRETAEEKVQEATALVAKLKEMGASTVEAEKMLTLASQSYADKDYKESLSQAVKSVEAAGRARKQRMRDILRDATSLMEKVSPLGKGDAETASALEKASRAIESDDLDGAYELSREAWSQAERNANRIVSEAFGQAQRSLLFAEKLGLKVDKQKGALRACRDSLESGDTQRSVDSIQSLLGALRETTLDLFVQRSGHLEGLLALEQRLAMDLTEAREHLAKGREGIAQARVEEAFTDLDRAEASFSRTFNRAGGAAIKELERRVEDLSAHRTKVQLGDLEGDLRRRELEERYAEAVDVLDAAREKVRAGEREALLKRLAVMQPRLRLANMIKKDVRVALQKMEEARATLKGDRFQDAYRLVGEANEEVEERLQGYDEVEEELRVAQDLRTRCEELELRCAEGVKGMGAAKRITLRGDFPQAVQALREAQRAFQQTLENHFAMDIMRLEMKLAQAMRLGAEVTEESAMLEEVTSKVRKGAFELVEGSLVTIGEAVEERTSAMVGAELDRADEALSRYTGGPEVDKARSSLAQAREKWKSKEFQMAHQLVVSLMGELLAARRDNLDRSLQEGRGYLDMARQLQVESVTLREKLKRAEELRALGRLDEASLLADEVASYGLSIVSREVDQNCTELMRLVAGARKEGVEIGEVEHLCEQASKAILNDDLDRAFELTMDARRSLNEVTSIHRRLRERLEEGEELMAEAKRSNAKHAEAAEAMTRARTLLSAGQYQETERELDRARDALGRSAPAFVLQHWFRQTAEMAKLRDRLGYQGGEARLRKLGAPDVSRMEEQLAALSELREGWEGEISAALHEALLACQKEVGKASAAGHSVGTVQQIIARGRQALDERRVEDAMGTVELAREELEKGMRADRHLNDMLASVEEGIEQLREMRAEVRDLTVLLEQARAFKRTENIAAAEETVGRAQQRSLAIAREKMAALMGFAGGMTGEREGWEDLRTARKLREDIEEALTNHRFRHAHLLARSFREELERVLQDKGQVEEELRRFEARLKEEEKAGLRPEGSIKALQQSRVLIAQGRFVQALSTVQAARDDLKATAEMYESRLSEYNSLRESLNSLEVLDARKDNVEELLDQCWSSLKELKFDSASLYLRRARNALKEFLGVRTNELLWEFNPLHDLIKRLKLQKRFASEIAEVERATLNNVSPRDLNRLSRNLELVRAGMKDLFEEQREKVRRGIEKASRSGKETGRSWEVWADSEAQAAKGDLWEAFNSLETAMGAIGRKAGETPEQLSRQLTEMLENAVRCHIVLQRTEMAYAEALEAQKQGRNPMPQLKRACEIARKEVRSTYPDITAELQFVGEVKQGRPMDVVVHLRNDAKHDARNVRAFIFGDAEVKGMVEAETLKAGESTKGRITIIPNKLGLLPLGISVKCKPLLSEEDVLYDSKFDLDVK